MPHSAYAYNPNIFTDAVKKRMGSKYIQKEVNDKIGLFLTQCGTRAKVQKAADGKDAEGKDIEGGMLKARTLKGRMMKLETPEYFLFLYLFFRCL